MRMFDLIERKRDGGKLCAAEIAYIIEGYTAGRIPDCQMAAWAMAVFFRGMDAEETVALTMAMARSGHMLEWCLGDRVVVDKHSTGGVGDKTTLVVAPLVAACGVPVAKMSGRGLGHTGGTVDKLLSIPGFRVDLSEEEMRRQVEDTGVAIVAQSASLVPADKKLYALRGTVACIDAVPLIASSVMSKKIAAGAQGIVLDVKYGTGAFMKTRHEAQLLADIMVAIGESLGRLTQALISPMEEPLGYAIGNSLEVVEAIEVLRGGGPRDLRNICLELAVRMLLVGGRAADESAARVLAEQALSGSPSPAWVKFQEFVAAQGGSLEAFWQRVQEGQRGEPIYFRSRSRGKVLRVDARGIGQAAMLLGAGRSDRFEPGQGCDNGIDPDAGIRLSKKCGDLVEEGEPLLALYPSPAAAKSRDTLESALACVEGSVECSCH